MPDSQGFAVEIPTAGARIEYVEFSYQPELITSASLALVKGPFRFAPHEAYECWTECGKEIVLFHLKRGEEMDEGAVDAFYMLTGEWP